MVTNASSCGEVSTTLKSDFRFETAENGSGISASFGTIQIEDFCDEVSPPAGAIGLTGGTTSTINYFRANVPSIQGSCGSAVTGNTVAVDMSALGLSCGDKVFIDGVGEKTVTDSCPACAGSKMDHYDPSATSSCSAGSVGDLVSGTRKTVLLNP